MVMVRNDLHDMPCLSDYYYTYAYISILVSVDIIRDIIYSIDAIPSNYSHCIDVLRPASAVLTSWLPYLTYMAATMFKLT